MALRGAVTPRQAQHGPNRGAVQTQAADKAPQFGDTAVLGLLQPAGQLGALPLPDDFHEGVRQLLEARHLGAAFLEDLHVGPLHGGQGLRGLQELLRERVRRTDGRMSAKRLLLVAQAAGYRGSATRSNSSSSPRLTDRSAYLQVRARISRKRSAPPPGAAAAGLPPEPPRATTAACA